MKKYLKLLQNVGLFAISAVATRLITFFMVPLYTFYMSSSEFGVTDMAMTVLSVVIPIITLSVSDGMVRFVIDEAKDKSQYISVGFAISVVSCFVFAAFLPVFDVSFFGGLGEYKLLFFLQYGTNVIFGYFFNVSRALDQIRVFVIGSVLSAMLSAGSAILFIAVWRMGIEGFFLSTIVGNVTGGLVCIIAGKQYRYIHAISFQDSKPTLKRVMAYSLPMIPNALFWWIGTSINRFFITGMIGIAASGLFAAAGKIPNLLNLFSQIFQQAWNLSAFQEFRSENVDKFFNTMYKAYTAFMSIGTALIILMTPFLAGIMLQKAFFKAWTLIPLLLLALFFNTLNAFFGSVFTAGMHTKYLFTSTAAGAICCIILNALLIPMYGLIGASIAMIASNALVWLLRIRTSRLFIQIRIGWPLLLATIAMLFLEAWTVSYVEGSVKWIAGVLLVVAIFGIQGLSVLPLACEYRQGRKLRNSTNN